MSSSRTVTKRRLGIRDGWKCHYCGLRPAKNRRDLLTRDHVVPRSRGGPNHRINLVLACKPCNFKKQSRPYTSFCLRAGRKPCPIVVKRIIEICGKIDLDPAQELLGYVLPSEQVDDQLAS